MPGLRKRFLLLLNVLVRFLGPWQDVLAGQVQVNKCIEQVRHGMFFFTCRKV